MNLKLFEMTAGSGRISCLQRIRRTFLSVKWR